LSADSSWPNLDKIRIDSSQPPPWVPVGQRATVFASGADLSGILSWLTPEAVARLNPWGDNDNDNDNADPGP
jgi:hypothetical protein